MNFYQTIFEDILAQYKDYNDKWIMSRIINMSYINAMKDGLYKVC